MLQGHTIEARHSDLFTFLKGDLSRSAARCNLPAEATNESLVYASEPEQLLSLIHI